MNAEMPQEKIQGYLSLAGGERLNLLAPEPSKMKIKGIASALSKICRFSGQISEFYSVAQHSVFVSQLVPEEYALIGLLHDATEAYTADMPKPIKQLMPEYEVLEDRMYKALATKFTLPPVIPEVVHIADRIAVITEARDLQNGDNWKTWYPNLLPHPAHVVPVDSATAEHMFLHRYHQLTGIHYYA